MSDAEIVAALAAINPYRWFDEGGNRVCAFCGFFRDFRQRHPNDARGAAEHADSCVWWAVRRRPPA